jgi:hypothetical protein
MTTKKKKKGRLPVPSAAVEVPGFDPLRVSELIEACRANVASLAELAEVTSRALRECYEYEDDEPHLWQCCDLVRQVLAQAQTALGPLGVISHETAPITRAAEVANGCEEQQQRLRPAVHVIRAAIYILRGIESNHDDQVLPALRDLETGIASVVDGLERAIQHCSNNARTDA